MDDDGSKKRKADTPLESNRPSPFLHHPRPIRPLFPIETSAGPSSSGVGLIWSTSQDMASSQPPDTIEPPAQAWGPAPAEALQPQPQCNRPCPGCRLDGLASSGLLFNGNLPPPIHINRNTPPITAWLNGLIVAEGRASIFEHNRDEDRPTDWDSCDEALYSIMDDASETSTVRPDTDIDKEDLDRPTDWDSCDEILYSLMDEGSETTELTPNTSTDEEDQVRPADWDSADEEIYSIIDEVSETTTVTPNTTINEEDQDKHTDWDSSDSELFSIMDEESDTTSTTLDADPDEEDLDNADSGIHDSFHRVIIGLEFFQNGDSDRSSATSHEDLDGMGFEGLYDNSRKGRFRVRRILDFLLYDEDDTSSVTSDKDIDREHVGDADHRSLDDPPGSPPPPRAFNCLC
ncbi:hypothetical protein BJY00DRAFT_308535 [Aspergillus carlsbadensis]|nr:hypothetical protein BJY00DRAFT_308535 [Aspergillus carlsbadensis]